MCLPPDVGTPALTPIGRRRDVNPSSWTPDPRSNPNWSAPPPQATGGAWPSWVEFFNLPQSGFAKDDGCSSNVTDAAPLGSLLASALAQQDVPKTWQPQPDWAAPQANSFYCNRQAMHSSYGSGMDVGSALMQSTQDSSADLVVSSTTNSRMTAQEPLYSIASRVVESLEKLKEEEKSQAGPWLVDELIHEGRSEQDSAAKKFCSSSLKVTKTTCQKPKQALRAGVKKETTSPKDVCMLDSDMEGSDEEGEGAPVISEKRRKRMLSNRASAQRSRQRRQERLDTLEVLVAQLRVENAALTRKANNAVATAKKLEDENKVLRERLDSRKQNREGQDQTLLPKDGGSDVDNQSLQTTGGNTGEQKSQEGRAISTNTRTGDTHSSSENSDPNKQDGEHSVSNSVNNVNNSSNANDVPSTNQQSSKKSKRSCDDALETEEWSFNSNFSSVFSSENMDPTRLSTRKMSKHRSTGAPRGVMPEYAHEFETMKGVSLGVTLPQIPAFQELEVFDIDLEHSPDIDKKLLESVEEIWLDGFSDVCFK